MPWEQGYWTKRKPSGGYEKLPVYFYRDEHGNLRYWIDPYGHKHTFSTHRVGNTIWANACNYYIAKVPPENWALTPGGSAAVYVNGRWITLHHPLRDIWQKRPDVYDYLARHPQYAPTCGKYSRPSALAEQAQKAQSIQNVPYNYLKVNPHTVHPAGIKVEPGPASSPTGIDYNDLYTPPPYMPGIGPALWTLAMKTITAVYSITPPWFQEIAGNILNEYKRDLALVRLRLGPERAHYYDELWRKISNYVDAHYPNLTVHERLKLKKQIWKEKFEPMMFKEAGISEEELVRTSPFIPKMLAGLEKVFGNHPAVKATEAEYLRIKTSKRTPIHVSVTKNGERMNYLEERSSVPSPKLGRIRESLARWKERLLV